MANVDIAITQDMVNQYHLYLKTPNAKIENLYRLWEKELKQNLDMQKWMRTALRGKGSRTLLADTVDTLLLTTNASIIERIFKRI